MNNSRRAWFKRIAQPFDFILDTYPAQHAYSFRKLRSDYNGFCCQIYRSSDAALQNFGFADNYFDVASAEAWLGGSNGLLYRIYNQGNLNPANNFEQTNLTNSVTIAPSGVFTKDSAGRVYIPFDGVNDFMQTISNPSDLLGNGTVPFSIYTAWNSSLMAICRGLFSSDWGYFMIANGSNPHTSGMITTNPSFLDRYSLFGTLPPTRHVSSSFYTPNTVFMLRRNGVDATASIPSNNVRNFNSVPFFAGNFFSGGFSACQLYEVILRNNYDLSDRASVESQINSFYNIF